MIEKLLAPRIGDDDAMATAGILHKMLIAICALVTLIFSFLFILPQFSPRWLGSIIAIYLLSFLLVVLNRKGKTRLASILLVGGLWIVMSALAYTANGIHSVAVIVFIIIIFIAGILLGAKAGFVTALVVILTNLAFTILELNGALPPPSVEHSPLTLWVVHTIFGLIVVYLQYIATQSIATGLRKAKEELAEREKVERALRESENRYRALVENSPDAIIVQQDDKIIYINSRAVSMLKLQQRSHAIGRSFDDFVPLECRNMLAAWWEQIHSSGKPVPMAEWKMLCTDGSVLNVEGMGVPITFGGSPAILSTVHDITVRKIAERSLRASEDLVRHTYDMSPDAILLTRMNDGKIIRWNKAFLDQLGIGSADAEGATSFSLNIWKSYEDRASWIQQLSQKGELIDEERSIRRQDGSVRLLRVSSKIINVNGEDIILTVGRDSTERMELESRIRRSEAKYRRLYENILEGFVHVDMAGQIMETNQAFLDMLGYESAEIQSLTYRDITPPRWQEYEQDLVTNEILPRGFSRLYQKEYIRKDGTVFPVELRTYLISDARGVPEGMWAFVRDITERNKAEESLKTKDLALELSINAVAISGVGGNLTYVNPSFLRMWGYEHRDEVLGRNNAEFWTSREAAGSSDKDSPTVGGHIGEMRAMRKDGTVFLVEVSSNMVPDPHGNPLCWFAAFIDITDRKKAEAELISAKEFAENLIRTADAIVVGLDTHGHIRIFNNAAERITGYSRGELEGRNWFEQIVPHDRYPEVWEVFQRLPKGELPGEFENPILTKGGEERFIVWRNSELREGGVITGSVSFGIDVTNQKRVEAALKQSESRLRQVIDLVPHFIFAKNRQGQFILANKAVADAYGTSVDGLMGKTDADFNPKIEEVEHFLRDDNEVIDNGVPKDIPEEKITDANGNLRILHTVKIPYKIASGREDAVLGVSTDITERKLTESTLRESEEQFRSLAEQSPNMIFMNQAGKVVYANQRCEELMGYLREELLDPVFDFRRLIHPDSLPAINSSFARHAKGEDVSPYEYGLLTKDGKRIDAIITTKLIRHKNAPAILGIVTDISERKKSETELLFSRQRLRDLSNRLQAIREEESRRIAREIHDELGQTLTALKMDLASLDERTADPVGSPDVAGKLTSMSTLVDSAIKSVRKIGSELRPVALDSLGLVAAIEWQAGDFMMRTGIHCTWSLPQEDLEIDRERSTALFRILQESLTNIARHSGATDVRIFFESSGDMLKLRIEDNGKGMDVADRRKAGSFGILGMRERASLFGGRVNIESLPGKGTILTAVVPLDDALRPATLFPGTNINAG